jgi:uncharacterized HAD superfamily protein
LRIGLDVDGTVYNWDESTRRILKRLYGLEITISQTWEWIYDACTPEQWDNIWNNHTLNMFLGGDYYPGAQAAVDYLIKQGHEVCFITATPESVRTLRAQCLFEDFPGISGVHFITPETNGKTHILCDVYLDDKVETAELTAQAGHRSLLMDRPWNHVPVDERIVRIHHWRDLHEEINK